jgi:hypothetical protein
MTYSNRIFIKIIILLYNKKTNADRAQSSTFWGDLNNWLISSIASVLPGWTERLISGTTIDYKKF